MSDLGTIYMVQTAPSGLVKIGYSNNPTIRLRNLMTMNSERISVLATFWGTPGMERQAHDRLTADRHHGEWFNPTAAVLALAGCRDSLAFLSAIGLGVGASPLLRVSIEAAMALDVDRQSDTAPAPDPVPSGWTPDGANYWGEWATLL